MSQRPISMIVWDLGGVLMSVLKSRVSNIFARYSSRFNSEAEMTAFFVNPDKEWWRIVNNYDGGLATDDQFFREMSDCLRLEKCVSLDMFRGAWQGSLEFKPDMLEFVSTLYQHKVEQGIISNLSRMHHEVIFAPGKLERKWFRLAMFSFAERCIKRLNDTEIFTRFIKAVGVNPQEILFVDDRLVNLVSAEEAGMQIFHFNRHCHHSVNLAALKLFLHLEELFKNRT